MITNIINKNLPIVWICLILSILCQSTIQASHNANRYYFFLEKPEDYRTPLNTQGKKFRIDASGFYTLITTAFGREGGNAGVPELWGKYDLLGVLGSLAAVDPQKALTIQNQLPAIRTSTIPFKVASKSKSIGTTLRAEWNTPLSDVTVGAWIPLMYVTTDNRYTLNTTEAAQALVNPSFYRPDALDALRRQLHDTLGLDQNNWRKGGVGDLDLYVRWHRFEEYVLLMRSIDIRVQGGIVVPTGVTQDINKPASFPFMGNGHWGFYLDLAPECELKQDLRLGCILSAMFQASHTKRSRIPVVNEPAPLSALIGRLSVKPGTTLKISPYLVFEHLKENLHLQIRYAYLRHAYDRWSVASLESNGVKSFLDSNASLDLQLAQERRSEWRAHYVTFQLSYTPPRLFGKDLQANFYCSYDVPINGNSIAKQHTITCGIGMAL